MCGMSSKKEDENHHDDSINRVSEKADEIQKKFAKQASLKALVGQAGLMVSMVKDYVTRRYREVPYWAISAVALALLYVLNPIDILPDVILGVGYLDDATVVAFCLRLIEKELERYKLWKDGQASEGTAPEAKPNGKVVDV
jgi:uncharacterized membrane protein YkvA (DUF1232 family)